MKKKLPHRIPVTLLTPPQQHDAKFLETLHAWGDLPEVVPVQDAARLLAVLCRQNPSAIERVLKSAIEQMELKFWGWTSENGGRWIEDLLRFLHTVKGVTEKTNTEEEITYTLELCPDAPIHWAAMGIRPADAVELLSTRGRKVPPELLGLLPDGAVQGRAQHDERPTPELARETTEQRQDRRLARLRELGSDFVERGPKWQVEGTRGALAELQREEDANKSSKRDKSDIRKDLMAAVHRERQGSA